jgi:hypothetical protein
MFVKVDPRISRYSYKEAKIRQISTVVSAKKLFVSYEIRCLEYHDIRKRVNGLKILGSTP